MDQPTLDALPILDLPPGVLANGIVPRLAPRQRGVLALACRCAAASQAASRSRACAAARTPCAARRPVTASASPSAAAALRPLPRVLAGAGHAPLPPAPPPLDPHDPACPTRSAALCNRSAPPPPPAHPQRPAPRGARHREGADHPRRPRVPRDAARARGGVPARRGRHLCAQQPARGDERAAHAAHDGGLLSHVTRARHPSDAAGVGLAGGGLWWGGRGGRTAGGGRGAVDAMRARCSSRAAHAACPSGRRAPPCLRPPPQSQTAPPRAPRCQAGQRLPSLRRVTLHDKLPDEPSERRKCAHCNSWCSTCEGAGAAAGAGVCVSRAAGWGRRAVG